MTTDPDILKFLRSRRSIRKFKREVVGRGLLNKLLEIGTYAPSAKNEQPWHWLVIQNPTEVKRLAGLVVDWIRMVIKEKPEIARQKAYHRVVASWKKGKDSVPVAGLMMPAFSAAMLASVSPSHF